jgi:D-lactate dehydrogenase
MKIAFFEVEEWERGYLVERLKGHELSFHAETLRAENAAMADGAEAVSVFIYSKIDEPLLAAIPSLKLVTTRSMGFDHIDLKACAAHGVTATRVPAYGERTVAEHAFALVLALSRKIFLAYERTEKGIFDYHGLQGFDLFRKTIGIVGGGKIGMNVAHIAKGFDMEILVADPFPKPELAAEVGFTYVPFEELLKRSDVISMHAPYMPATHHMINETNVMTIKRGAILVNTARGALVDTKALLKGLESGVLSGAGLDVLEEECTIKEESELMGKDFPQKCDLMTVVRNHMLIARNDVVITPHIAFNSREAVERILGTTVENITGFIDGKPVNTMK